MSPSDQPALATMEALNAVVDALQEADRGDDEALADTLNLVVNLTGHLAGDPEALAGFRAGGPGRELVLRAALAANYGGVPGWLAELVAPLAPGIRASGEA